MNHPRCHAKFLRTYGRRTTVEGVIRFKSAASSIRWLRMQGRGRDTHSPLIARNLDNLDGPSTRRAQRSWRIGGPSDENVGERSLGTQVCIYAGLSDKDCRCTNGREPKEGSSSTNRETSTSTRKSTDFDLIRHCVCQYPPCSTQYLIRKRSA